MHSTGHHNARHLHWQAGLCVAFVGIALSLWLAWQQSDAVAQSGQARFTQAADAFARALAQRIDVHTEVVSGMRGLFTANPRLSRADFERAVAQFNAGERYPGVRNLSFTRWVPAAERAAFEARVRADLSAMGRGNPEFSLAEPVNRPGYYLVDYFWPVAGNERVLAFDISAQPANLQAMEYARISGETVATAPFELMQEQEHRTGFLIRMPVYDHTSGASEPPFIGAVASTVRVYDLVRALHNKGLLDGLAVEITDHGSVQNPDSDVAVQGLIEPWSAGLPGTEPVLRELRVHDRRWRLSLQPTRSFLSPSEARLPLLMGVGGVLVSLLLASTIGLLVRGRGLALARATVADAARRESEERFGALFNQPSLGVAMVDSSSGRFLQVNQHYAGIVGYSVDELLEMDVPSITHPSDQDADTRERARLNSGELPEYRLEKRLIHRQGHVVWIDVTVSPMWSPDASPEHHIGVVQDISARKRMEETLRSNEHRLRSIFERLPMGLCLVQPDGRISFRNQRYVEITGYSEAAVPDVDTWWQCAYPDAAHRESVRAIWLEAMARARERDGVMPAAEYTFRSHDGQQRTVELSGVQLEGEHLVAVQDMSQRKAAEDEINTLAYYDPLTRLPNRRLLRDRLQQALATSARHGSSGALLLLDLDNFKTLNETRGHECGDILLQQVAHRLRSCVHEDDTVARQGGDEFVVLLEDLSGNPQETAARSEEVGRRILAALRVPYELEGDAHHTSISMGITVFTGMRETVDELLKRADLALYQAKDAGRDTLRFYDPQMQAAVSARAALELDMRTGMASGQFELYYQPQIDNGRITGAEALMRWRRPQGGFVSPAEFIPLAEDTGLILPLGEWALQNACDRLAQWASDPALADLSLAVNVSPREFHQENFVTQVLAALASSGADGRRLKLEMTEGLLLQDVEDTVQKMSQLKGYGVGFSLDDFGTGYSSLAYLKRLPLDQLKIDQSFVRDVLTDPNDAAIARTVVALGTSLGLRVIAEGVETEAQRDFLARNHCHAWQGYLLSPPVPVADFVELVYRTNGGAGSKA